MTTIIDASALVAILKGGPEADRRIAAMATEDALAISAGPLAEFHIVAATTGATSALETLMDGLVLEVVPVTSADARLFGEAYGRWGKERHPAGLNFGDRFVYALARGRGWPRLFVGDDFAKTDVSRAWRGSPPLSPIDLRARAGDKASNVFSTRLGSPP